MISLINLLISYVYACTIGLGTSCVVFLAFLNTLKLLFMALCIHPMVTLGNQDGAGPDSCNLWLWILLAEFPEVPHKHGTLGNQDGARPCCNLRQWILLVEFPQRPHETQPLATIIDCSVVVVVYVVVMVGRWYIRSQNISTHKTLQ